MDKLEQLDQIAVSIVEDGICKELAASATQLVFGDGSPDADMVFVGEAPGKNEDEQGLPFVGAAGKFLNEMLESVGFSRSDVYITNIVKYRPPGNRDPLPGEKTAFWPYLVRQLEVIQPKLIVTLGRHSMEYFLPDQRISRIHGQPKRIKARWNAGRAGVSGILDTATWVILPLYHPAAALYNGGQRKVLMADFAKIPKVLSLITNETQINS